MSTLILANPDHIYALHPRPRWSGRVLAFVPEGSEGRPMRLDTGDELELELSPDVVDMARVIEVPWMRMPRGMRQVVVLSLDSRTVFANHEDSTREVVCRKLSSAHA